jgi:hypothetical protein
MQPFERPTSDFVLLPSTIVIMIIPSDQLLFSINLELESDVGGVERAVLHHCIAASISSKCYC